MFGFCPLASGSRGNCVYIGSRNTKILLDAGISGKATLQRLELLGVDIKDIDAIVITHEHHDHIQGLKVLAVNRGIPIIANSATAKGICKNLGICPEFQIFTTGETFSIGDLELHPFSIQHDTPDPAMFTIKMNQLKLGFCTDLGFVTSLVRASLKECDYLYLEANHQPSMVHASPRPLSYKQRVLSRSGHLSNDECAELVYALMHSGLKHVHLAHLSEECNHPELALKIVRAGLQPSTEVSVAPQKDLGRAIYFY